MTINLYISRKLLQIMITCRPTQILLAKFTNTMKIHFKTSLPVPLLSRKGTSTVGKSHIPLGNSFSAFFFFKYTEIYRHPSWLRFETPNPFMEAKSDTFRLSRFSLSIIDHTQWKSSLALQINEEKSLTNFH